MPHVISQQTTRNPLEICFDNNDIILAQGTGMANLELSNGNIVEIDHMYFYLMPPKTQCTCSVHTHTLFINYTYMHTPFSH